MHIKRAFKLTTNEAKNLKTVLDTFGVKLPMIKSGEEAIEVPEEVLELAAAVAALVPTAKRAWAAILANRSYKTTLVDTEDNILWEMSEETIKAAKEDMEAAKEERAA